MGAKTLTISLDEELLTLVRQHGRRFNVSAVAATAIRTEIERLLVYDSTDVLEFLREDKAKEFESSVTAGAVFARETIKSKHLSFKDFVALGRFHSSRDKADLSAGFGSLEFQVALTRRLAELRSTDASFNEDVFAKAFIDELAAIWETLSTKL